MNSKKLYKLLSIMIISIFIINICSMSYSSNEKITKDFKIVSYVSLNDKDTYSCQIDNNKFLSIDASEFNLPSNLYDYKEYIRMRVTYTEDDLKVYDCKVLNYETEKIIEDLSEENINKLFNIEYGKDIKEKAWCEEIKLSEINENTIYKYKATSTTQFPKIENDTGKNCLIHIKEKYSKTYELKINTAKNISRNLGSTSFNEYNSEESFYIMYEKLENNKLLKLIEQDEIIYLSKYKDGEKLQYNFHKFIYNDTDKDITINAKDSVFGAEKTKSIVISKGEIYGFDWMIDEASISFEQDRANDTQDNKKEENTGNTSSNQNNSAGNTSANQNNNTGNTSANQNSNNNNSAKNNATSNKVENTKDTTTISNSKLPKTGTSNILVIAIIIATVAMIIFAIKLKSFKDVK